MHTRLKISKNSIFYLAIFLVLVLEHNCFYLISKNMSIFGFGISDLCALFETMLFLFAVISSGGRFPKSNYNWLIATALILVASSAIAGFFTYGQSILSGINVQRNRIASLLFFFPLLLWYRRKKITAKGILKTLGIFIFVYLCICILQYFLSGVVTFVYTGAEGTMRYGSARYWFSGMFLVLFSAFCVDALFENRKKKLKPILVVAVALFFFFSITKTRMSSIAFTGAVAISLILHRGSTKMKVAGIVAIIIGLFILSSTNMGNDLLDMLMGGASSQGDTVTVRQIGREYYVGQTCANPIRFLFGNGYASGNNSVARSMTYPSLFSSAYGYNVDLYPQDNGVVGMFYYYGFIGIVWWIIALGFSFVKGMKIYKSNGKFSFIFMLIFDVTACLTSFPFMLGSTTVAAFYWILMMDSEYKSIENQIKSKFTDKVCQY